MAAAYRSNTLIPDMVKAAKHLSEAHAFSHYCSDEAGRLLAVLTGQVTKGKILEIGTGYGVGSSWILSAIAPSIEFLSVDHSKEKIDAVTSSIVHTQAAFICDDWKEVLTQGPFRFIFADASAAKTSEAEHLFQALDQGGMLFMDDFTPEEHFPEEWKGEPDKVREYWLNHQALCATEIYLTPTTAAILATKKGSAL